MRFALFFRTAPGGELMQAYGAAAVKPVRVPEDGVYIDAEKTETLKNCAVTGQSIALNTERELTLPGDSASREYDFAVTQSIEEIEITVMKDNCKTKVPELGTFVLQ